MFNINDNNEYDLLNISSPQFGKKVFHIEKIKKCKMNKPRQNINFNLHINNHFFQKNKFNFFQLINNQLQKHNSTPDQKNIMIINDIIDTKPNHFLAIFKDFLISDYVDEFLKRYFTFDECEELIPKFHLYYKNYLKFFCKGFFIDFKANKIVQDNGELQAELYYNNNYGSNNGRKDKKEKLGDSNKSGSSNENQNNLSKINKIKSIFSKSIKKKISGIESSKNQEKNEISNIFYKSKNETMTLNNDTRVFNDDNIYTNENSLLNLLKSLINKKMPRKKMNENKIIKNNINEKNIFRIYKNLLSESPIKSARYQNYIKNGMYNKTTKKLSSIKIFTKNIPMIFKNKNHNLSNDMKTPFLEKTKINSRNNQSRNSRTNFSSRGNNSINIFIKNSKSKKSNKKRKNNSKSSTTRLNIKNFTTMKLSKSKNKYSNFTRNINHKISKKVIYNVLNFRNNSNNSFNSSRNYQRNYKYSFQSNNSNYNNNPKKNDKIKHYQNIAFKNKSINKHKIQSRIFKQKQNLSLYNSNSIYNNFHININNNIMLLNSNNNSNVKHFIQNKNNIKSFSKQKKASNNIQNNNYTYRRNNNKNIKSRNEINNNLNKYKTEIRNMQVNLKKNNKILPPSNKKNICFEKSKSKSKSKNKNKSFKNKEHLIRNKSNLHFNNNSRLTIKKFNQKDMMPSLRNFKKLNNTNKNPKNQNNQKINMIFDYKRK